MGAQKYGSGTGSIGLNRYYVMINGTGVRPRILEMKQVTTSVLDKYIDITYTKAEEASRVVGAAKASNPFTNVFMGNTEYKNMPYLIRERNKFKAGIKLDNLDQKEFANYAFLSGRALGIFHSKVTCGTPSCESGKHAFVDTTLCEDITRLYKSEPSTTRDIVQFAVAEAKRHNEIHHSLRELFAKSKKLQRDPVELLNMVKHKAKDCRK
eukprot:NODE_3351_length_783_cov_90.713896_g2800_i0.p1 GENE.NODE_3351_length_783_cov_90.713896_g2800_i0~~NODE_3351_length_783_cov_90.713896_g2800_i0.p1  ORF type:complete len:219 (+),score=79.50 NODE_3351_length_783_cov_90.713896_g2800_i0:30-659(+)